MAKEDVIEVEGRVVEVFRATNFKVQLYSDEGKPIGAPITATISGKLRKNFIKVLNGDKVRVEMSPYCLTNGRIVWRYR